MSDYIKRQDVLPVVCEWILMTDGEKQQLQDMLEAIPAADVRPNARGKWIANDDGDGMHCSVCKTDFCYSVCGFVDFNFCPNCGASMADMRGEGKCTE